MQAAPNESSDDEEDEEGTSAPKKPKVVPLWKRLNKDGFTPLTLAAQLAKEDMFSFLLDEGKITQWSYGPVSCVLYPLEQVDLNFQEEDEVPALLLPSAFHHRSTFLVQEKETQLGALEIIVKNAHVELIMHPRLIDLVNKKWERFARRIFFHRFLVTLSYLLVFLITTILDQTRTEIVKCL